MTEEAKAKRDELANNQFCVCCNHYDEAYKLGFDAGYQVAMDEMSGKLNKLENFIAKNQIIIGNEKVIFIKKEDDSKSTYTQTKDDK